MVSKLEINKLVLENSDSEMEVDLEIKLGEDGTLAIKSPKAAKGEKAVKAKSAKSPKAAAKSPKVVKSPKAMQSKPKNAATKKNAVTPKKMEGVKRTTMKAKANAAEFKSHSKNSNTSEMVIEALTNLKSRKGITLASIRKYIQENYDLEVNSRRATFIKAALQNEFDVGHLKNVEPSQDGQLKLNHRFMYSTK